MAALTPVQPTAAGVPYTWTAVSASDTISSAHLGQRGAYLLVNNGGGSPDTVAISDAGKSPAGNSAASSGGSVTNATSEAFYVSPKAANAAGLVTVTHSFTTSVTCLLLPTG